MSDADPMNVLWICTDQQFAEAMSCAGNTDVDTPAMDRLAERGVRFENAYCTDPVCVPSRGSMFTGRMPHELDIDEHDGGIDPALREEELGPVLTEAGYDCAHGGKWHLPELSMPDGHGFEVLCEFDDTKLPGACEEFLARDHDDPFLLSVHFDDPHNICEWSRNQNLPWGNVEPAPVEECPTLPQNFAVPPFEPAEIRPKIEDGRWWVGAMADADPEDWRQYRDVYYKLVERVDRYVGQILDALDEQGLTDDTVVIFTSDHGDGNGAHQLKEKYFLYEEEVRVPMIVAHPDEPGGRVEERLVSNGLDIFPTICDVAGVEPPARTTGRSLLPLVESGPDPDDWRDQVVAQTEHPLPGRMLRTERYKYIVYEYGEHREQLFDLREDPGEMVDLATDADHADVLADHRERLLSWCVEHRDEFGNPHDYPGAPRIPGYEYLELRERFEAGE